MLEFGLWSGAQEVALLIYYTIHQRHVILDLAQQGPALHLLQVPPVPCLTLALARLQHMLPLFHRQRRHKLTCVVS